MNPRRAFAFSLIGVAVASVLSFSVFGADEASPVAKPDIKAGDRWTYQRTNYLNNTPGFRYDDRIASSTPGEMLMVRKQSNQPGEFDIFVTPEWGFIVLGGMTLIPRAELLKFPLTVGATYNNSYETANKGSPARSKYDFTVKVIGWEDITVPAGKFRALKVEANGTFIRLDAGQRLGGAARFRYWYVPEIKRWAKVTYEDATGGLNYPNTTFGDELLNFSVQ